MIPTRGKARAEESRASASFGMVTRRIVEEDISASDEVATRSGQCSCNGDGSDDRGTKTMVRYGRGEGCDSYDL